MTTKHAYVYVLDTLADWEIGYLSAELNSGRFFAEPGTTVPVRLVGANLDPVTTMGGLRLRPDVAVADLAPADVAVLILPGADTWAEPQHAAVAEKARELLAESVPVGAICGGTSALAAAGLLDDRPHTSNDLEALKATAPNYRGEHHYVHTPAVTDGDLITGSGTAPIDFTKHVLARLDVMTPAALEAWYQLFGTNDPQAYPALMNAIPQPVS